MIWCPLTNREFPKGTTPKDNCIHYEKGSKCGFYKSLTKKCETEVRDVNDT